MVIVAQFSQHVDCICICCLGTRNSSSFRVFDEQVLYLFISYLLARTIALFQVFQLLFMHFIFILQIAQRNLFSQHHGWKWCVSKHCGEAKIELAYNIEHGKWKWHGSEKKKEIEVSSSNLSNQQSISREPASILQEITTAQSRPYEALTQRTRAGREIQLVAARPCPIVHTRWRGRARGILTSIDFSLKILFTCISFKGFIGKLQTHTLIVFLLFQGFREAQRVHSSYF